MIASANHIAMRASDVMRKTTLTVKVHGMKRMRARWWVALRLMRLAATVAGCGFAISDDREVV